MKDIKDYTVVEVSELIDNKCPICSSNLTIIKSYYSEGVDNELLHFVDRELLYTDAKCEHCGTDFRIFND